MDKFESVFIVRPNKQDAEIKSLVEDIKNIIIKNDGVITKTEELGKKKLAYEIKKCTEGYYIVFEFEANEALISELEKMYRANEDIIKYLNIKKDDEE